MPGGQAPLARWRRALWALRSRGELALVAAGWAFACLEPGLGSADPDLPWQLAVGRLSFSRFAHGHYGPPLVDPWSWTAYGHAWQPNGWGFDLVLFGFFRLFGYAGVALLRVLLLGLVAALLWRRAGQLGAGRWARAAAATIATMLLSAFSAPRPQLASFVFVLIVLELAEVLTRRRTRGWWWAIGGLGTGFSIWACVHGDVVAGVAFAGAVAGASALGCSLAGRGARDGRAVHPTWFRATVVGGAVALGSCGGVYGFRVWPYAFSTRGSSQIITEWAHASLFVARDDVFFAIALVSLAWALRRRAWPTAAAIVVAAGLGADAVRSEAYILLVAVAALAGALEVPLGGLLRIAKPVAGLALGAAALVSLVSPSSPPRDMAIRGLDAARVPVGQIDALPSGCRLLDDYDLGGWVIWLRPGLRVSLDPRNDLYGSAAVLAQLRVVEGRPGALAWVRRHDVTCALLERGDGLVAELTAQRWAVRSRGPVALALVAPGEGRPR